MFLCCVLWSHLIFYCPFKFGSSFLSEINLLAWQRFAVLKLKKADLISLILWINRVLHLRAVKFSKLRRAATSFKAAAALKDQFMQIFVP